MAEADRRTSGGRGAKKEWFGTWACQQKRGRRVWERVAVAGCRLLHHGKRSWSCCGLGPGTVRHEARKRICRARYLKSVSLKNIRSKRNVGCSRATILPRAGYCCLPLSPMVALAAYSMDQISASASINTRASLTCRRNSKVPVSRISGLYALPRSRHAGDCGRRRHR